MNEKKTNRLTEESQLNSYFMEALVDDKRTRVEFIRKGKGQKVGVMIACVDPLNPKKVLIGFSLCHTKWDSFDHINFGMVEQKNIGKKIAHRRAMKYRDYQDAVVYDDSLGDQEGIVYIPASVNIPLVKFMYDSYKYYKDKEFPLWVENHFPKEDVKEFDEEIETE